MGQREVQRATDDLFDQFLLAVVAQPGDQTATKHGGVEERFNHARAAQFLEHGRDVETKAAETALILGEERTDHAKLGQFCPDFGAHTLFAVDDLVAGFRIVFVGQIATQGILQHLPFFSQVEIQGIILPSSLWR